MEVDEQELEFGALRHVPGHNDQNGRKGAKRNVARKGRGHEHEEQDEARVQHARDGTMGAGPHIGCGAGNGAGGGDAAKNA